MDLNGGLGGGNLGERMEKKFGYTFGNNTTACPMVCHQFVF